MSPASARHRDRPPGTGLSPHRIGHLPLDPGRAPAVLDRLPINLARPIYADGIAAEGHDHAARLVLCPRRLF
ncbi:hypothetical protein [Pseudogemmobacter sonorensis]|uniref:hypothetical protein n=1 Tax=Pseudogemmobacter sonorensis TaxID=2989681 RepID=UPI0036AB1079